MIWGRGRDREKHPSQHWIKYWKLWTIFWPIDFSETSQAEIDHLLGTDQEKQKKASALFLLKLKESKQVSQVVIDEIVGEWDTLFSHTTLRIQAGVRASLAAAGIDSNTLPGLDEVFDNIPKPFDGLETRFKQEKYYRESLFLVISMPHYPPSRSVKPRGTKGYLQEPVLGWGIWLFQSLCCPRY